MPSLLARPCSLPRSGQEQRFSLSEPLPEWSVPPAEDSRRRPRGSVSLPAVLGAPVPPWPLGRCPSQAPRWLLAVCGHPGASCVAVPERSRRKLAAWFETLVAMLNHEYMNTGGRVATGHSMQKQGVSCFKPSQKLFFKIDYCQMEGSGASVGAAGSVDGLRRLGCLLQSTAWHRASSPVHLSRRLLPAVPWSASLGRSGHSARTTGAFALRKLLRRR